MSNDYYTSASSSNVFITVRRDLVSGREGQQAIEAELRGTTLRVYWEVFKSPRPVGVREVQRLIRFSSPSTALYHLEKLRELGVVRKNEYGHYEPVEEMRPSQVRMFLRIGRVILPRYVFYAVFFVAAVLIYLAQSLLAGSDVSVMALVLGFSAALVCTYEAVRIWKDKMI
jgi:DNA-binding transcriptional ArsR family regulator